MKRTVLILALISVVCSVTAAPRKKKAAQNARPPLTLEQAFAMAERDAPELQEVRALVDVANGRLRQAGALPNPELIVRGEALGTGKSEFLAGVGQEIPINGTVSKGRQVARADSERLQYESEAKRLELRKKVQTAFATALYQSKANETLTVIAENTAKAVSITKARLSAGDALPEDVARIEMELARAQAELRRTKTLRQESLLALASAIGNPLLEINSLEGKLETAFEIPTVETLARDLATHPAFLATTAAVKTEEARVDLEKAKRIPNVKVELLYRRVEDQKRDGFDVGVSIPLPLFDRNRGNIDATEAEVRVAEARSRSRSNELNLDLRQSHAQLTAALDNIRLLKSELLPRADTVLKSAEARYAGGDISFGEILPVRREWAASQLAYLEALREVMASWATVATFSSVH